MGRTVRLAVGAIAAALAADWVSANQLLAAVVMAIAALLVIGEVRPRAPVGRAWPVVVGAGMIALRLAVIPAGPPPLQSPPAGSGPWVLVVESTGSPRDGQQSATLSTPPGSSPSYTVAATLPRYPPVVPGDRVLVDGPIRPRPDSPFGAYLERIGAVGTLKARTLAIEPASSDLGRRLEDLRRGAAEGLAAVLPEPEAGLAAGILIGLRDRVDRDLAASFTTAGVSHVVAISGWNIAIVAAAVAAVAGRLGRRRRSLVMIVAIVAYVAFAGASASVVRAAAMAGVVLLARESGRAGHATAALGWAATLLLLADPDLIGDAGFQLSSLATAGLIAWATPLSAWLDRIGRGRLPRWLTESLGVSLAAQAATLPIVLVSFGRLAIIAPLVNLAVVPLVAPAMAAGLVGLAGGLAVQAGAPWVIGAILAAPGWVILRVLIGIVNAASTLPFASLTLEPPIAAGVAVLSVAVLATLTRWHRRRRRPVRSPSPTPRSGAPAGRRPAGAQTSPPGGAARRGASIALVVVVAVSGGVVASRPSPSARITILDVGQGDAVLVEGSRGGRLLVDGGPDPDRLLVALDRRIPPWDRRIDTVILSHPHEDHVAGLPMLLERYRVDRVMEPGMRGPGPGYAAWLAQLSGPGTPVRTGLGAGDRLTVDEITMRVLWPVRGRVGADAPSDGTAVNNVSVVLLGQIGAARFLLMGDVEEEVDPELLAGGLPEVALLKVAHHGSRTATTDAFVEMVRPRVAVASAGAGNPYGHPTRFTLERLAGVGARVLRTDLDGTVVVGFGADGISIGTERPRPRSTPRPASSPSAIRFRCAIPVTAILPEREAPTAEGAMALRPLSPASGDWARSGPASTVGYHRLDDPFRSLGSRLPAALAGSPTRIRMGRARPNTLGRPRCRPTGHPCHRRVPGDDERGRRRIRPDDSGRGRAPPRRNRR